MRGITKTITAALTAAALAGTLTACGGMGGPSSDTPGASLDLSSMPEVTVPEISVPDGSIPDVTVESIHIDIPDTSVPDIYEYFGMTEDTNTAAQPADTTENADSTAADAIGTVVNGNTIISNGTITDDAGEFTYTGALVQGGDDENGYIQYPADFVNFQDYDVDGLTQYCDKTAKNIITLDYHKGVDYHTAADSLRAYLETKPDLTDLNGATVTVAGYQALQIYGHYTDGYYVVTWLIEDPSDTSSSYYLAMEFDSAHQYMIACSSTFQTVADHNA